MLKLLETSFRYFRVCQKVVDPDSNPNAPRMFQEALLLRLLLLLLLRLLRLLLLMLLLLCPPASCCFMLLTCHC